MKTKKKENQISLKYFNMGLFFSHDRSYRITKFLTNSEKIKEKIETPDNIVIPNFDWLDGEMV